MAERRIEPVMEIIAARDFAIEHFTDISFVDAGALGDGGNREAKL